MAATAMRGRQGRLAVALALACCAAVPTHAHFDLSSFYSPRDDPLATRDPYTTIPEADKAQLSVDDGSSLSAKLESLQRLVHKTHLQIVLVGMEGDGNGEISLDEAEFHKYLDAFKEHDAVHVLGEKQESGGRISQSRNFQFDVVKAPKSLNARIQDAIHSAAKDSTTGGGIPYTVVDNLIKAHHATQSKTSHAHIVYLLNPSPPPTNTDSGQGEGEGPGADGMPTGRREPPPPPDHVMKMGKEEEGREEKGGYFYVAVAEWPGEQEGEDEWERERTLNLCGVNVWVGEERYWWVDLTAGPVAYGPSTSGEGFTTHMATPAVDRFARKRGGLQAQEFVASLSALVRKGADILMNPPLHHFPVKYHSSVTVHLFVIHDGPGSMLTDFFDMDEYEGGDGVPHHVFDGDFDFEAIESQISQLKFVNQDIIFERSDVSLSECELCALAYSQALKTHSSNVLHGSGLRTHTHPYLDSKELHGWLKQYATQFWDLLSDSEMADYSRTIPVFLFSLQSPELVLLDRFHQAVGFDDMVVAVQTKAGNTLVDYSCNGKGVTVSSWDATRPVLAAILQTGWGVTPNHHVWSYGADRSTLDFQYAIGHTPFLPFSSSKTLSFSLKDAATRNVLYTAANHTMAGVAHVLEHVKAFEKEADEFLNERQHLEFVRRWNVFKFKMEKGLQLHTLHQFNSSLYYFLSADHDVHEMWRLVNFAGQSVVSYYDCMHKATRSPWEYAMVIGSFSVVGALLWATSHKGKEHGA